eukprot:GFYU01001890.1.p1 GENE.GFYU01001890.1~~GFYU01001890.1.p1  ORF type:complete len:1086 (+),score=337.49 GFYU01001890.1:54-3260(+)
MPPAPVSLESTYNDAPEVGTPIKKVRANSLTQLEVDTHHARSGSVSGHIVDMLHDSGVKTVFGVPGAYSIHCVDTMATRESQDGEKLNYVLASHEGGAAYAALGYGQASRSFGCTVTTAGPGAFNAITSMATAKADGGRVLMVHGEVPTAKLGRGALQDSSSYGCDIRKAMSEVASSQYNVESAKDFSQTHAQMVQDLTSGNATADKTPGPVHLCVPMDVFAQTADLPLPTANTATPAQSATVQRFGNNLGRTDMQVAARIVLDTLVQTKACCAQHVVVLVGAGADQADAVSEVNAFLRLLKLPVMVTARGVSGVDHSLPHFIGQHSIFPHHSSSEFLAKFGGSQTDVLLALGTSLGEFATNSWCKELSQMQRVIHVNHDASVFGRLGHSTENRLDVCADLKSFMAALVAESVAMSSAGALSLVNTRAEGRLNTFLKVFPQDQPLNRLSRSFELLTGDTVKGGNRPLCGQRLVHDLSNALNATHGGDDDQVHIVSDTGSSKLYAAHYIKYRPAWRSYMPGGTIDTMGYAVSASIGVASAVKDATPATATSAPTICITGDGALFMNNELNTLAANTATANLLLIVFVLNDSALSYVHQGFAAVMERPLQYSQFSGSADISAMAHAFGIHSEVVERPGEVTAEFMARLIDMNRPVIVDCRVSKTTVGPGYERYNSVRGMLGKSPLSVPQMTRLLKDESESDDDAHDVECVPAEAPVTIPSLSLAMSVAPARVEKDHTVFGGGGNNRLHLYGWIQDVFMGTISPRELLNAEEKGVDSSITFGLGVSAFADDTEDVGDGVFINGRFFVRRTDAGMDRRRLLNDESLYTESNAVEYRTGYSLGIKSLEAMEDKRYVYCPRTTEKVTMRNMLEHFIGPERTGPNDPGRVVGFVGVVDYEDFWGTSLSVAPTQHENILLKIDEYARPGDSQGPRSGICVGFVRTSVHHDWDDEVDHALYHRMFFDNPRDNSGRPTTIDGGGHWISHTHGIILPLGTSMFDILGVEKDDESGMQHAMDALAADPVRREAFLQHCWSHEDIADVGHVIPTSSLKRYFFSVFDVHHVDVFNPTQIMID